jgi:hypothetical protein
MFYNSIHFFFINQMFRSDHEFIDREWIEILIKDASFFSSSLFFFESFTSISTSFVIAIRFFIFSFCHSLFCSILNLIIFCFDMKAYICQNAIIYEQMIIFNIFWSLFDFFSCFLRFTLKTSLSLSFRTRFVTWC